MRTLHKAGDWTVEDLEDPVKPRIQLGHDGDPCPQEVDADKARVLLPYLRALAAGAAPSGTVKTPETPSSTSEALLAIREIADGRRHYDGDELWRALGDIRALADAALSVPYETPSARVRRVVDGYDDLLVAGNFGEVDRRLAAVDVAETPVRDLLAALTVTFAARKRLNERGAFFAKVQERLRRERPAEVDDLLRGLGA